MPGIRSRLGALIGVVALTAAVVVPVLSAAAPAEAAGIPAPQGRTFFDLGVGYQPTAMNAAGTVVGTDGAESGAGWASIFSWRNGTATELTLPTLDGYDIAVSAPFINAQGDVAATVSFTPTSSGALKRMAVPYIWVNTSGGYGAPQAAGPQDSYADEDVVGFTDTDALLLWINEGSFTLADGNTARWGVQVTGPFGADPVAVTPLDNSYPLTMIGQDRFIYQPFAAGLRTASVAAPTTSAATTFAPSGARSTSHNGYLVGYNASSHAVRVAAPDGTITTLPTPSSVVGTGIAAGVDSTGDVVTPGGYLPSGGTTWQPLSTLFPDGTGLDPASGFTVGSGVGDGGALFGTAPTPGGTLATSHGWVLSSHAVPAPVVNSTGDAPARDGGASGCDTGATVQLNGATVAECTLRAAIQAENAGSVAQKTISFASGFTGTSIAPATPLPALTASGVTLDFSTAPSGFELTGSTAASPGLDVRGSGAIVRGLHAVTFATGLLLEGAGGTTVVASTFEDSVGVEVTSPGDRIGGTTPADRDLFPHDYVGVYVHGTAATGTSITGSWFGLAADGATASPNDASILIRDAAGTTIGGSTSLAGTGAGNVLVAGQLTGTPADGAIQVFGIDGAGVSGTTIAGNTIGLAADGTTQLPAQARDGILVAGVVRDTVIGGAAGSGNVVDADAVAADPAEILIASTSTTGTQVLGNRIGTDAAGAHALAGFATQRGVYVKGATHSTIGLSGDGNTIVGAGSGILQTLGSPTEQLLYPTAVDVPGTGTTQTGVTSASIGGNSVNLIGSTFVPPTDAAFASTIGIGVNGSGDTVQHNIVAGTRLGIAVLQATGSEAVTGNVVGLTPDGLSALYSGLDIYVEQSTGTVVSQNSMLGRVVGIALDASPGATVTANTVGVAASGNGALRPYSGTLPEDWQEPIAGAARGIRANDASTSPTITGNVVGGIAGAGVEIDTSGAVVSGNHIGVGSDGTTALGNSGAGVELDGATSPVVGDNLVGTGDDTTLTTGGGNLIGHNGGAGISLTGSVGARLLSNLMIGNAGGISNGTSGGPLGFGAPSTVSAENGDGRSYITIELTAGKAGMVQLYAVPACPALGSDPRAVQPDALLWSGWLHATPTATTDFAIDIPAVAVGTSVASTITDPTIGTSAFSACFAVAAGSGAGSGGSGDGSGAGDGDGTGSLGSASVTSGSVVTKVVVAGGTATVVASGFLPGEQVGAELHSAVIDLGTFRADASGDVTITFTVPADLPAGLHHVVLTGLSSGRTVTIPITVSARTSSLATTGVADAGGLAALAALSLLAGVAFRLRGRSRVSR
jgi:hypothetical protein